MRRGVVLTVVAAVLAVSCGLVAVFRPAGGPPVPGEQPGAAAPYPGAAHGAAAGGSRQGGPAERPLLAVVGASVSAGVGADNPNDAWPQVLARMLNWRVVVSADPGAGYLSPGAHHLGPFARLAGQLDLSRLDPAVVLIQGGHNDIGRPLDLVHKQVCDLVATIRRESPRTRLGVLTVFSTGEAASPAALATDRAIVAAARQTDPQVMVFDPLAMHWRYPRVADRLHPSPAGHRWIAEQLAAALEQPCATGQPATAGSGAAQPTCGTVRA